MTDEQKEPIDASDALAALAAGESDTGAETPPEAPVDNPLEHPINEDDAAQALAVADAAEGDGAIPLAELEPPVDLNGLVVDPNARKVRAATYARQSGKAHAHQFKSTMIPLLLVVGVLLLGFSAFTGVMLLMGRAARSGMAHLAPSRIQQYGPALIAVSLPLAAVLLVGALWFHLDIKKRAGGK
ncbi:MAG TPA: hypothetical protein DCX07_15235 [Phycisphaerales bacterium]|nr:hypothetical protein [Phycisphaerales bacterium]